LKPWQCRGGQTTLPPFRVQQNAAPLKPSVPIDDCIAAIPFRVQQNAAPLKPECQATRRKMTGRFPRSTERGPIEATLRTLERSRRVAFRVQQNAAPLKPLSFQFGSVNQVTFRVQQNAAPLKPAYAESVRGVVQPFPRSTERGPIEAFVRLLVTLNREAFRVQQNAAPLKPVEGSILTQVRSAFRVQQNAAPLKPVAGRGRMCTGVLSAFNRTRPH